MAKLCGTDHTRFRIVLVPVERNYDGEGDFFRVYISLEIAPVRKHEVVVERFAYKIFDWHQPDVPLVTYESPDKNCVLTIDRMHGSRQPWPRSEALKLNFIRVVTEIDFQEEEMAANCN